MAEGKEAGVGRQGGQTAGWPQSFAGESFAPGAGLLRIATDPLPYSLLAGMGSVQAVPPAGSRRRTATQLGRCDHGAAGNLGVAAGEPSPSRSRWFRTPQCAAAAIASWRCPSARGWWAAAGRLAIGSAPCGSGWNPPTRSCEGFIKKLSESCIGAPSGARRAHSICRWLAVELRRLKQSEVNGWSSTGPDLVFRATTDPFHAHPVIVRPSSPWSCPSPCPRLCFPDP